MGSRVLLDKSREIIEKRGSVSVAELAYMLDRSYNYTKYNVVRILAQLNNCIKYDDNSDELIWVCDEG